MSFCTLTAGSVGAFCDPKWILPENSAIIPANSTMTSPQIASFCQGAIKLAGGRGAPLMGVLPNDAQCRRWSFLFLGCCLSPHKPGSTGTTSGHHRAAG